MKTETKTKTSEWPKRIAPGYYRLTRDVKNPDKDGRSRDWHKQPVFKQGTHYFVLPYQRLDGLGESVIESNQIQKPNARSYNRLDLSAVCYEEFLDALEPVLMNDERFLQYTHRLHDFAGSPEVLLQALLRMGTLTREQILQALPVAERMAEETVPLEDQ